MGSACKTGKEGTARHMVCVWRRLAGSSGAGNFGRWKEIGSFSLSGEFLCFVRANRSNAAASLHYREIRKSGEIPDGIFQRIGVCCSAYGRLAFYTGTHEEAGRKGRSFWIRDFACRIRYFSSCQCRKGRRTYHAL